MKILLQGIATTIIVFILFYILGVVANFLEQHFFITIVISIIAIISLLKI